MRERLVAASPAERARLRALCDAPMDAAEFARRAAAPLTPEEIAEPRELVAWFTRRYPTGAERLAYARRAWERWSR